MEPEPEKKKETPSLEPNQASLVSLALDLGFSIAIPIVGLAFLGRMADRWFDTSPILMLVGIFLSMFVSVAIIYRKVKDVIG